MNRHLSSHLSLAAHGMLVNSFSDYWVSVFAYYLQSCCPLRQSKVNILTPSSPMVSNGYISKCLGPYWSIPPFISDIWALWRSVLSARVPECQKLKRVGYTTMVLNSLVHLFLPQSGKVWGWKGQVGCMSWHFFILHPFPVPPFSQPSLTFSFCPQLSLPIFCFERAL